MDFEMVNFEILDFAIGMLRNPARITLALVLALLFAVALTARPAQAAPNTFAVDSLGDAPDANTADNVCHTSANECTLRAAIQQANATTNSADGPDEIDFGVAGTVSLTSALPDLSTNMNIMGTTAGSGNTVFRSDGTGNYRIFNITNNSTLDIKNLTLSGGVASDCGGAILASTGSALNLTNSTISGNTANAGGGICNLGTATIKDSIIGINFATSGGAQGGGIRNVGTLSVEDSLFNANSAGDGGGIYNDGGMTVVGSTFRKNIANAATSRASTHGGGGIINYNGFGSVVNSTFYGNSATAGEGGGLLVGNPISLVNDTIAGNTANSNGGGISDYNGSRLQNTLVAKNTAPSGPDVSSYPGYPFTSRGNNLIGDASGSSGFADGANGDQVGSASNPIDPKLQSDSSGPVLQDNGGPTETIALLPGSPAIDAGSDGVLGSPLNLTTDQRGAGFPRQRGAHVDIGAFEVQNQPPQANDDSATVERGVAKTLAVLSNDQDPDGDTLNVSTVSNPSHGTATVNPDNTVRYAPQADYTGPDSFTYTVSDGNGNTDTATVNVTVTDTVKPTVSRVVPAENVTGVGPGTNVYAFFSEPMRAASINGNTFRLYKKGSTTQIPADVTLAPSNSRKAILNPKTTLPNGYLERGATYKAVVSTGAKDAASNPLASSKVWYFTVKP